MNLYIHIPFCKRRCSYCDFYTLTGDRLISSFVDALCIEIKQRLQAKTIDNIYIGGGTPSVLSIEQIKEIFNSIEEVTSINKDNEITIEVNPDDIDNNYVEGLIQTPINRVSMGGQSFIDKDLIFLNRRHNAKQIDKAIDILRGYGIENISLDLIYGLPNQTTDKWQYNLDRIISIKPPHISAYHLMYEEGTPLTKRLEKGIIKEVPEDLSLELFSMLITQLKENGYEHYEISNFAQPNYYAKLNTGYWQSLEYMGLGPAAHGYDGKYIRRVNKADIRMYVEKVCSGKDYYSIEELTDKDIKNEYIMTRLRTRAGIDVEDAKFRFGQQFIDHILKQAGRYIDTKDIMMDKNRIYLTSKGIFISDTIISDLFI